MEFFIYLCNMFRKRHDILDAQLSVNELRPRTKEINEQIYYRRSMRFRAQATPLDNREAVAGLFTVADGVCAFSFIRVSADSSRIDN